MTFTITNMRQWVGNKVRIEMETDSESFNYNPDASIVVTAEVARKFTVGDRVDVTLYHAMTEDV